MHTDSIAEECKKRAGLPSDAQISLYKEIQTGAYEVIVDWNSTLENWTNGDIIVFHKNYYAGDSQLGGRKLKSLEDFYDYSLYK